MGGRVYLDLGVFVAMRTFNVLRSWWTMFALWSAARPLAGEKQLSLLQGLPYRAISSAVRTLI